MPRLAVVGSLNLDYVFTLPHLPAAGETLAAVSYAEVSGGKGANQAVAAARLGADVTLIGCVGEDDAGRRLRREVTAAGVTDAIATVAEPSGAAFTTNEGRPEWPPGLASRQPIAFPYAPNKRTSRVDSNGFPTDAGLNDWAEYLLGNPLAHAKANEEVIR